MSGRRKLSRLKGNRFSIERVGKERKKKKEKKEKRLMQVGGIARAKEGPQSDWWCPY